jgi:hypothetical protein
MSVNRGDYLHAAARVSASAALGSTISAAQSQVPAQSKSGAVQGRTALPSPALSGIEHVVVVMMEKRVLRLLSADEVGADAGMDCAFELEGAVIGETPSWLWP